jgi:hypothetical protein
MQLDIRRFQLLRSIVVRISSCHLSFVAVAFLAALPIRVNSEEVPSELTTNAKCMLAVLKMVPGVSEPRLGSDNSHGWNHPFLEYRATEGLRGSQRMRFDAQKSTEGHYWFLAYLSGWGNPEIHVTDQIIQSWKTQCGVSANVIFP